MKKVFLLVLISAVCSSAFAQLNQEEARVELQNLINNPDVAALENFAAQCPVDYNWIDQNIGGQTILHAAVNKENAPVARRLLLKFNAPAALVNSVCRTIERSNNNDLKQALNEYNHKENFITLLKRAKDDEDAVEALFNFSDDNDNGIYLPLDGVKTQDGQLLTDLLDTFDEQKRNEIKSFYATHYDDKALGLHDLLIAVCGNHADLEDCEEFLEDHKGSFQKGGFGDLDQMNFQEEPVISWAEKLLSGQKDKPVQAMLYGLNEYRTDALPQDELLLLINVKRYLKNLAFDCLLSSDRHNMLVQVLGKQQDLLNRKIIPAGTNMKQIIAQEHFLKNLAHIKKCPSLKLFPQAQWLQDKVVPGDQKINLNPESPEDEKKCIKRLVRHTCEGKILVSQLKRAFENSQLDVDLIKQAPGISLGRYIDESTDVAEQVAAQNDASDDEKNEADTWKEIQDLVKNYRSYQQSWLLPTDQYAEKKFVDKVLSYLITGDEDTLKNLQSYAINTQASVLMYDLKNYSNRNALLDFLSSIKVGNAGILAQRIDTITKLHHVPVNFAQGAVSDVVYGEQVTQQLLKATMKDARFEALAKEYYGRYKVSLSHIQYQWISLDRYIKAYPHHEGSKRIRAIMSASRRSPKKGNWDGPKKLLVAALVVGIAYLVYAQNNSSDDDADTTAVA